MFKCGHDQQQDTGSLGYGSRCLGGCVYQCTRHVLWSLARVQGFPCLFAVAVGLCVQVAVLFKNHNDLLTQFTYFLPDNSPPQVRQA